MNLVVNFAERTVSFSGHSAGIDKADIAHISFSGENNAVHGEIDRVTGAAWATTASNASTFGWIGLVQVEAFARLDAAPISFFASPRPNPADRGERSRASISSTGDPGALSGRLNSAIRSEISYPAVQAAGSDSNGISSFLYTQRFS